MFSLIALAQSKSQCKVFHGFSTDNHEYRQINESKVPFNTHDLGGVIDVSMLKISRNKTSREGDHRWVNSEKSVTQEQNLKENCKRGNIKLGKVLFRFRFIFIWFNWITRKDLNLFLSQRWKSFQPRQRSCRSFFYLV